MRPDYATRLNVTLSQIARFRERLQGREPGESDDARRLRGRTALLLDSVAGQFRELELDLRKGGEPEPDDGRNVGARPGCDCGC